MLRRFTLEYWIDEGWYVGRLKEISGVFSQGRSLEELEENIREAYRLMMEKRRGSLAPRWNSGKGTGSSMAVMKENLLCFSATPF